MSSQLPRFVLLAVAATLPAMLHAQLNFNIDGREVQVHSFASQGFLYSNDNNYLTTDTSKDSFAFTDFGGNISAQINDKFRVGAQVFGYNLGHLGNWKPNIDWAMGDYRFKSWFGVRAGKVKTVVGLYNDTQDMQFLHTWALVPQSVYPMDLRGDDTAHLGADLYGDIPVKKLGSFSYTLYGDKRPFDSNGGYVYSLLANQGTTANSGRHIDDYGGPVYGSDLRWTTPVKGLMAGVSLLKQDITTTGYYMSNKVPYKRITFKDNTPAYYAQYTYGNFRFDGEYRREVKVIRGDALSGILNAPASVDIRSGYVSGAYRFSKWLELGSYHSRYYPNWNTVHSVLGNHLFDQTFTARLDLRSYLDFKIEGHFIRGAPTGNAVRGFYPQDNPLGLFESTHLLVLRLGYHI